MRTLAVTGRILMATTMIAGAGLGLVSAGSADAQQRVVAHGPGAGYPMPGTAPMAPRVGVVRPPVIAPGPVRPGTGGRPHGPRWGSKIGGHWWGGVNAPGGWNAYRRPHRGWVVPNYWISPRFYISDWQGYGLSQPPYGYNWLRYYDDAVLIDARGRVIDAAPAIGWDDDYGDPGFAHGADGPWHDGSWQDRGPRIEHHGPGPAPSVYYGPNGATTIVIRTEPSVATTTTTTTESYVTTTAKRAWKQPTKLAPRRMVQTKTVRAVQTKPAR